MKSRVSRRRFLRDGTLLGSGLWLGTSDGWRVAGGENGGAGSGDKARLLAVRAFADRVLDLGRDRWSGLGTPLFADGLNVRTREPVRWRFEGESYIVSNLASQQNLFRTLDMLTRLTGDARYRRAAEDSVSYHFEELLSGCGLPRWGGHQFIDLATLAPVGRFDADCHELKNNFPYWELMWRVNPEGTARCLRAFWNAHILDWGRLDMNRHGAYGRKMGALWAHEFQEPEPLFEGRGLTFINTGTDLIHAGLMLHLFTGEAGAFEWAERLAHQYVRARHPETGLGVYQYSRPMRRQEPPEELTLPSHTYSTYGDRAENQFGREFGEVAREAYVLWGGRAASIYARNALVQLHLAERLGDRGRDLLRWTVEGMKAYVEHGYEPGSNRFRALWADGTDMTGHVIARFGYYGPVGTRIGPVAAGGAFLMAYARAFRLTRDPALWETVRQMAQGNGLGDWGGDPGRGVQPNPGVETADPEVLFALLEIWSAAGQRACLDLARRVADNILARRLHGGWFVPSSRHVHVNFNADEPLALLSVQAALRGDLQDWPAYVASRGYIHGRFDGLGRTTDQTAIWGVRMDGD
jgi:pectate lyase